MTSPASARVAATRTWLVWAAVLCVATIAMAAARPRLDRAHAAPLYLLLVVLASARAGRAVGMSIAIAAFFLLNYLFVLPLHTLVVREPLDWLVLLAFLVTAALAAQLLTRAQEQATAARQRAEEIDRLAAVGAEALSVGRAEDALARIAEIVRVRLALDRCDFFLRDASTGEVALAASSVDADARPESAGEDATTEVDDLVTPDGAFRLPGMHAMAG